jgi:hypothetical protein
MTIIEQHVTPDERLRFLVIADADGDVLLGFEGYEWHTHADILAGLTGLSEAEATRQFVDHLLSDRSVIALEVVDGKTKEVWVADDPLEEATSPYRKQSIELRYWSGRVWSNDELP